MALPEFTISKGGLDPIRFKVFEVKESRPVFDSQMVNRLKQALTNPLNFGGEPYRCFSPGLRIEHFDGTIRVEHQVCLKCLWIWTFSNGKQIGDKVMSEAGRREFTSIYEAFFGTLPNDGE